jgi:adenylosuccinate lyase
MIARYTRPEMGAIWSEQHKYESRLKVELAASRNSHWDLREGVKAEIESSQP